MVGLIIRDITKLWVEMNERTRCAADDIAVRVRTARRGDTVAKTFSVEVAGKDRVLHAVISIVVIGIQQRLKIVDGSCRGWLVRNRVRDFLCELLHR